jgi:L-2-hydroxyglutarate oxidase LhgO
VHYCAKEHRALIVNKLGFPEQMGIEITVVGAGVVGLAVARRLKLLGHDVLLLERHAQPGMETSSRNSEVIHAGLYYPEGSLRARLCVTGRRQLLAFCAAAGVPHRLTGKLIVATSEAEVAALDKIAASANANGAVALERLSRRQALAMEPDVTCVEALYSPGTGIIDTHQLMLALQAEFENAGGLVVCNTDVTHIGLRATGGFSVQTTDAAGVASTLDTQGLVIAAGLGAQRLGTMLADDSAYASGYRVPPLYPAKGHYFSLSGRAPFRHLIYPVPHGAWLGVHLTLNMAGQARFGPDIAWRDDVDYAFDDADGSRRAAFEREVRRYWPGLPDRALQPDTTGVRPKLYAGGEAAADFAIHGESQHGVAGLVALYGIESPGLTSCLAIADLVAETLSLSE